MSTPAQRLKAARKAAGYRFASAAAEALAVSRDTYTQHENGQRAFDHERAAQYARRFRTTPEWLLYERGSAQLEGGRVPILGYVGANPDGTVLFGTGQASGDWVPPPPNGSLTARALEVRGHSMPFFADDGALIYFDNQQTQPRAEMLGQVVVTELETDEVLVKRLLRGSDKGVFDLQSIVGPTLRDARLRWVAEIVAIIPPLEARRLVQRGDAGA